MLFSSPRTIVRWLPSVLERIRMGDWVAGGIGNGIPRLSPPGQPLGQIQPGSAAREAPTALRLLKRVLSERGRYRRVSRTAATTTKFCFSSEQPRAHLPATLCRALPGRSCPSQHPLFAALLPDDEEAPRGAQKLPDKSLPQILRISPKYLACFSASAGFRGGGPEPRVPAPGAASEKT